jgi:hypothetical protein
MMRRTTIDEEEEVQVPLWRRRLSAQWGKAMRVYRTVHDSSFVGVITDVLDVVLYFFDVFTDIEVVKVCAGLRLPLPLQLRLRLPLPLPAARWCCPLPAACWCWHCRTRLHTCSKMDATCPFVFMRWYTYLREWHPGDGRGRPAAHCGGHLAT